MEGLKRDLEYSLRAPEPTSSGRRRWSGGATVLGKLLAPGVLLLWITVGQGLRLQ